jgi:hypothetical protein
MSYSTVTGIAGVSVISGVTPFTRIGTVNFGGATAGTPGANGYSVGTVDLPNLSVAQSIVGLGSGNANAKIVTNQGAGYNVTSSIKGTGATPSWGQLVTDGFNSANSGQTMVQFGGVNQDLFIINSNGQYVNLTNGLPILGNGLPDIVYDLGTGNVINRETYSYGGIRPTGANT